MSYPPSICRRIRFYKLRFRPIFILLCFVFIIVVTIEYLTKPPSSSTFDNSVYRLLDTSFKRQLFHERILSYNSFYEDSNSKCKTSRSLTLKQQQSFGEMSQLLPRLRQRILPYPKRYFDGRGIVLVVSSSQLKLAQINLKLIELTDTKLPVQIWYSSSEISHEEMLTLIRVVPKMNITVCCFIAAECRTLSQIRQMNFTYIYGPQETNSEAKSYSYRAAAIISATFAEVLFLDCDAYLTRDPEELFLYDPMYHKFGALFFPDATKSRQHPTIWKLFNTTCAKDEYEFDSSVILVNKRQSWNALYFAKLMNDEHEVFSKYAADGDQDIFRLAFRYMKKRYYLVMTPCSTGFFNITHFCGFTLCKTDSLSQYIYVNHVHTTQHMPNTYSLENFGYTRIGLGDPNNNSFFFRNCHLPNAPTSCFHILTDQNDPRIQKDCYYGSVSLREVEDRVPTLFQPLLSEKSTGNRIIMSKSHNVMPYFVESFLRIVELIRLIS